MTDEPPELGIYNRLQALAESRLRGVDDPALDRALAKTKAALVRELIRCVQTVERLPVAKDFETALEQRAKRSDQVEYLRATIAEMDGLQS